MTNFNQLFKTWDFTDLPTEICFNKNIEKFKASPNKSLHDLLHYLKNNKHFPKADDVDYLTDAGNGQETFIKRISRSNPKCLLKNIKVKYKIGTIKELAYENRKYYFSRDYIVELDNLLSNIETNMVINKIPYFKNFHHNILNLNHILNQRKINDFFIFFKTKGDFETSNLVLDYLSDTDSLTIDFHLYLSDKFIEKLNKEEKLILIDFETKLKGLSDE